MSSQIVRPIDVLSMALCFETDHDICVSMVHSIRSQGWALYPQQDKAPKPPLCGGLETTTMKYMFEYYFEGSVLDRIADKAEIADGRREEFCEKAAYVLCNGQYRWMVRGRRKHPDPGIAKAAHAIRAARAAVLALDEDQLESMGPAILFERPAWLTPMILRGERKDWEDVDILLEALEAWDNAFGRVLGRSIKQKIGTEAARPAGATTNVELKELICELWWHVIDCGGKLSLTKGPQGNAVGTVVQALRILHPALPADIRQGNYRYSLLASVQRHVRVGLIRGGRALFFNY